MGVWGLVVPLWPDEPHAQDCGAARADAWPAGLDQWVVQLGVGTARDVIAGGWRVYHRYFRPRPGTVEPFRVNRIATELLCGVEPDADPLYEQCVIVGVGSAGEDCNVPPALTDAARTLSARYRATPPALLAYGAASLRSQVQAQPL